MGIGQMNLLFGAEKTHRMGPGCQEDLLRRIRTDIAHHLLSGLAFEFLQVRVRLINNFPEFRHGVHRISFPARNLRLSRFVNAS
ncbi:MAG: hypothetical protein BWX45_00597 [Deltaproteobacteria bacterium ADurb.Bin002]|nr:MAG: hypothetical protein BWX45_00597 [Deltaproteobacteria bacterium ADurb.Bin002]